MLYPEWQQLITTARQQHHGRSNAYGERMTEGQEQQLERRLTKLCEMN